MQKYPARSKKGLLRLASAGFKVLILSLLVACGTPGREEPKPPFWEDIQAFKKKDSLSLPAPGAILFIGSSSFTRWQDVQDYFPGYRIINRGFGSSTLPDLVRYAKDIISPYKPRQVVIYCGENDLASSDTVTATIVAERFQHLFAIIRDEFTDLPVVYISMKPSPSRRQLLPKMLEANLLINNYLATQKNTVFIDIHQQMLGANGEPIKEIYVEDSLHMNASGYAIWQKAIVPYLIKD